MCTVARFKRNIWYLSPLGQRGGSPRIWSSFPRARKVLPWSGALTGFDLSSGTCNLNLFQTLGAPFQTLGEIQILGGLFQALGALFKTLGALLQTLEEPPLRPPSPKCMRSSSIVPHFFCQAVSPSVRLSLTIRFFLHISYITRLDKFLEVPTQNIMCGHMIWTRLRQDIDKK